MMNRSKRRRLIRLGSSLVLQTAGFALIWIFAGAWTAVGVAAFAWGYKLQG
jgi:hypothetical protein